MALVGKQEEHPFLAQKPCQIPQILYNSGVDFQTINIISKATSVPFETTINIPHFLSPFEILALFDGGFLDVAIEHNDRVFCFVLENSVPESFEIDHIDKLHIECQSETSTVIEMMILHCVDMHVDQPFLKKDIIIYQPEQGMTISFNLEKVIYQAVGWETIRERHVQIRHPDGKISNIKKTSVNYRWREGTLLCCLPVGMEHAIRLRIKGERWSPWSQWLKFKPTRKMTL